MIATAGIDLSDTEFLSKVAIPIATFIVGFFTSRLSMSKKERKDHQLALQKNADNYQIALTASYETFTRTLATYAKKATKPDLDDFFAVSASGEAYFTQMRIACDGAFSGTIPSSTISTALAPTIKDAWERSIPKFYEVLSEIAAQQGLVWNGELRRENYSGIADFYEKYCIDRQR